jgi:hypothetical protein
MQKPTHRLARQQLGGVLVRRANRHDRELADVDLQ